MTHLIFDRADGDLKLYREDGTIAFAAACSNKTIGSTDPTDPYGHHGPCPPGTYGLAPPDKNDPPTQAEGAWFVPMLDASGIWLPHGRWGIGIHGGGSGLADPLAARQGWYPTEGCFRLQNEDLETFVQMLTRLDVSSIEFTVT